MQCTGLDPLVVRPDGELEWEQRVALCERLLSGPDRPTAVFTYSADSAAATKAFYRITAWR